MKTFIQSRASERDLDGIFDYLAAKNPAAAEKVVRGIFEKFALLCEQPEIGKQHPNLPPGIRSFPSGQYVVFYELSDETIEIRRILHGSRDVAAILRPGTQNSENNKRPRVEMTTTASQALTSSAQKR